MKHSGYLVGAAIAVSLGFTALSERALSERAVFGQQPPEAGGQSGQSAGGPPPGAPQNRGPQGFTLDVGGGFLAAPVYDGDDAYQLSLLPNIRLGYGDVFFASVQEGVGFNLINTQKRGSGWKAGPIGRLNFGRDETGGTSPFQVIGGDTDDLLGLGDISATFEVGGFASYAQNGFELRAEGRQALGGHDGFVGDLSLQYRRLSRVAGKFGFLSIGPRLRFADDDYFQSFFGITPAQSALSGLDAFEADGGLLSVGAGLTQIVSLSRNVGLVFVAGYDRLLGDAADNPLVTERGTPNQFSTGLFLSYRFGL